MRNFNIFIVFVLLAGVLTQDTDIFESDSTSETKEPQGQKLQTVMGTMGTMGMSQDDLVKSSKLSSSFQTNKPAAVQGPSQSLVLKNTAKFIPPNSPSSEAKQKLRNVKWVKAQYSHFGPSYIYSPCFHNPCPKNPYSFYILSTCNFEIQLISDTGRFIKSIGNGSAWNYYKFNFDTPCGKYKIKIVLNCPDCPYVQYKMGQDRSRCLDCPGSKLTYNPQTCTCQCSDQHLCPFGKKWRPQPQCMCSCAYVTMCPSNQYYNYKTCQCDAFPNCLYSSFSQGSQGSSSFSSSYTIYTQTTTKNGALPYRLPLAMEGSSPKTKNPSDDRNTLGLTSSAPVSTQKPGEVDVIESK